MVTTPPAFSHPSEWAVLHALPAMIAVLDREGRIVATNAAWERGAHARGGAHIGVGADYREACRSSGSDPYARAALDGLDALIAGRIESLELGYPCPAHEFDDSWFLLQARPVSSGDWSGIVVVHSDISAYRRGLRQENAREQSQHASDALEHEQRELSRLGGPSPSVVTQRAFGLEPLAVSSPAIAAELRRRYREAMKVALDRRFYKVASDERELVRALAERLVFLRAGPRDVVDLHQQVLVSLAQEGSERHAQACYEEGRVLLVALMGEVASSYRSRAVGRVWLPGSTTEGEQRL